MITTEERIYRLQSWGYSRRESEFLVIAALHSGFFLRRQYRAWIGSKPGWADNRLITRMMGIGHGQIIQFGRYTQVYHLCSHPFYSAIGEPDNRHRRMRSEFSIKTKLMALDFVLSHPEPRYLPTESEKIEFFCGNLDLPKAILPTKTYRSAKNLAITERYFVDKFPIFISSESSHSPVVSFCYIDEGSISTPGFETWLIQYRCLFDHLSSVKVVYVATTDARFSWAERLFRRFIKSLPSQKPLANIFSNSELLRYFELEDAFRNRDFSQLDTARLDELKRLRDEFSGSQTERLFRIWKEAGKHSVLCYLNEKAANPASDNVSLTTRHLPWQQDAFHS